MSALKKESPKIIVSSIGKQKQTAAQGNTLDILSLNGHIRVFHPDLTTGVPFCPYDIAYERSYLSFL